MRAKRTGPSTARQASYSFQCRGGRSRANLVATEVRRGSKSRHTSANRELSVDIRCTATQKGEWSRLQNVTMGDIG